MDKFEYPYNAEETARKILPEALHPHAGYIVQNETAWPLGNEAAFIKQLKEYLEAQE